MNDTHEPNSADTEPGTDPISALAAVDPAAAPAVAEALAADLASELEAAGAAAPQTDQDRSGRRDS